MKTLVKCNWCETVTNETELELRLDNEHCPLCGYSGHLMDVGATETKCAVCGDEMTVSHSNYAPIWSDHYDNVVCFWCGTHPNIEGEGQ